MSVHGSFYLKEFKDFRLKDCVEELKENSSNKINILKRSLYPTQKKIKSIIIAGAIFLPFSLILSASPLALIPILKAKNITHLMLFSKSISIYPIILTTTTILGISSTSLFTIAVIKYSVTINRKNSDIQKIIKKMEDFQKDDLSQNIDDSWNASISLFNKYDLNEEIDSQKFNKKLSENLDLEFAQKNIALIQQFFIVKIRTALNTHKKTLSLQKNKETQINLKNNLIFLNNKYQLSSIYWHSPSVDDLEEKYKPLETKIPSNYGQI
ncbi:MAG: hypothetical protein AMS24_02470 [Chlamydiae bacterium SM23_39]|nr:MAG: hypothetical protein AMS24_02470 [Chlamydiae bacterium SM23_39]